MKKRKSEVKKGAQLWKQYYWWLVGAGQTSKCHCLLICWTFLELKTNKNGFGESEQSGTQPIPWRNSSPKYKKLIIYLRTWWHSKFVKIWTKLQAHYNEWDLGFQAFCMYWSICPFGKKQVWNGMKIIINDRIIIEGELFLYISMLLNHERLKQLDSCAAQCECANYGTQSVWWFISHHDNASWLLSGTHTHDGSHAYCGALEVHPTAMRE